MTYQEIVNVWEQKGATKVYLTQAGLDELNRTYREAYFTCHQNALRGSVFPHLYAPYRPPDLAAYGGKVYGIEILPATAGNRETQI